MKKFEIENAKKQAKHRRNKAIVLTGALAFGTVAASTLFTACPSPTQSETPVVPTTYSATLWEKTITVKDERSDKTASIDTLVSKLQTALSNISSGLDTIEADVPGNPFKADAADTKSAMITALNRGFTITVSDTAVTSTEKVKVVDNKTVLINSDFITTADFSWADKTNLTSPSVDLESVMYKIYDSGKLALNLKAKNAVQLAAKPAMLAQKGKSLAALDMKKRNNNAMVAMKNAARVRLS